MVGLALAFALQAPTVGQLLQQLGDDHIERRDAAERAIREQGSPAIPALEEAARRGDGDLALRARRLLSEIAAPSALVEDLRSDDVPGNARRARSALIRSYDASVRERLLAAVRSDDDQQAIQAAFILLEKDALEAAPDLLVRAAAAFLRGETGDYGWVAGRVMLGLSRRLSADRAEAAWAKALRGISPKSLDGAVAQACGLAREQRVAVPLPLLRHYLKNFRDDNCWGNAFWCRWTLRTHKEAAVPALEEMLADPDLQARSWSLRLLLDIGVPNLPAAALPVMGEILGQDPRALSLLVSRGDEALPVLEKALQEGNSGRSLAAARGLVSLDPERWRDPALRLALVSIESDNRVGNAREGVELLVEMGPSAEAVLREALGSDDEQAVACAALALELIGKPAELRGTPFDRVYRLVARRQGDEDEVAKDLLRRRPELLERVLHRLVVSGSDGRRRAVELLEQVPKSCWLRVEAPRAGGPQ